MNEGRLLVLFLIVCLAILYSPYMRAVAKCRELQRTSRNLIRSPQCTDDLLLRRYGPAQQQICDRAHEDLHVSPWLCAVETVWSSAELYQALQSHWLMFGLAAVVIVTMGWVLIRTCNHDAEMRATQHLVAQLRSLPPPVQQDEAPRRRLKLF